jgi:hypothetical protein
MEVFTPAKSALPALRLVQNLLIQAQQAASFQAAFSNVTVLLVIQEQLPVSPRHGEPYPS